MKLLKKVRNKVSYIVKMKIQKGIIGCLRKNRETRNKTEAYNTVSNLNKKKKKSIKVENIVKPKKKKTSKLNNKVQIY